LLGLILLLSAIRLNKSLEKSNEKILNMGLCQRVKSNYNDVCTGLKIRGVTRLLLYLVLAGGLVPNYEEFLYQYMVGPLEFNDLQIASLKVGGIVFTFFFLVIYHLCCLKFEIRFVMVFNICFMLFGKGAICLMLKGVTLGMSKFWFLMFSDSAIGEIYNILTFVPTAIVYGKMIPNNIESTVFSLLTGLNVFSNFFVNRMFGNFINRFVGVNKDNLEDLYTLYLISFFMSLLPLLFLPIIPSKKDIDNCQSVVKFIDEYKMVEHKNDADAEAEGTTRKMKEDDEKEGAKDMARPTKRRL